MSRASHPKLFPHPVPQSLARPTTAPLAEPELNPPLGLHCRDPAKNSLFLLSSRGFDGHQQLIPSCPTASILPWAERESQIFRNISYITKALVLGNKAV